MLRIFKKTPAICKLHFLWRTNQKKKEVWKKYINCGDQEATYFMKRDNSCSSLFLSWFSGYNIP